MIVCLARHSMAVDRTSSTRTSRHACDLRKTLSSNLREFRRSKRITQDGLAEICGLHRNYIGAVERGERNVTLATLARIADALEVAVPKLLTKLTFDDET